MSTLSIKNEQEDYYRSFVVAKFDNVLRARSRVCGGVLFWYISVPLLVCIDGDRGGFGFLSLRGGLEGFGWFFPYS